mmetsp:Transcript_14046/g.30668  ORF Transcript_14046/g.30668 Transcript_14046/m.30668 type:complete len:181 (+) Transcript_14046:73-615(+)|eukprot:CAMPEP_0168744902 /NCGR_PEP_ID=MMETSP0724-20121128/14335_1 /TAXON_ID=265536 /ORGANISM="Amphiprora sp., Strain CCMP467" /LENGTH=180 /DNA_ID=CAMNT_0008792585 /DNA_START=56 /DNA_END=598 /DNA_ORIENTATION=+
MIANDSALSLPSEWEHDNIVPAMEMMDEEMSAASSAEASKVFEQWRTDGDDQDDDYPMDLDGKLGSGTEDVVFFDHCPTTSMEDELSHLDFVGDSLSLVTEEEQSQLDETSSLSFQQRYEATLHKLAESMKRSQETRKSLVMKTTQTESYSRTGFVCGVVESIESSSRQIQNYIKEAQSF